MVNLTGKTMNRARGFTIIEILIALVIFSVVSVALVKNVSTSIRHAAIVEEKTIAWWLADNQMTKLRLSPRVEENFPSAGTDRELIEQDDVSWEIETRIEGTENEYVHRVVISVYKNTADDSKAELIGFIGRY